MKIGCFKDKHFLSAKEYNCKDIDILFKNKNKSLIFFNHKDLERLTRKSADILIIPYIKGNFSDKALKSLVKFHSSGGSIFFLGDIPYINKSYPGKNMLGYLFHLTRESDTFEVDLNSGFKGLTEKGKDIIGDFKDIKFLKNRAVKGLRITAYPPDRTYPLLRIKSFNHAVESSSIMVVERRSDKFLGAKFAMIGFNGGEPRENIEGVYQREWKYDPGHLTREWKDINNVVWKIIEWLKPAQIGASIKFVPVVQHGSDNNINVNIKNLSNQEIRVDKVALYKNNRLFFKNTNIRLAKRSVYTYNIKNSSKFGINRYRLEIKYNTNNNKQEYRVEEKEWVYASDSSKHPGYGISTYFAFLNNKVYDEYKYFLLEMKRRGVQYVRVNIPWEDVEPVPGKYNWRIPDKILNFAQQNNILIQFWMFPTTRGSGLSDGGVPWWVLKEPAIDRYGNKGFFPSIWSPFYREHYFKMIDKFTKRYADADMLLKFVIDFGNSDFPYGYYYYYNDPSLFDYSVFEKKAFNRYLEKVAELDIAELSKIYKMEFHSYKDIPVPYPEQREAYKYYLEFRSWSIGEGMRTVYNIVKRNAPEKLSSDYPGHGIGSIADIGSYIIEAKSKHWLEEQKFDKKYTYLHNSGKRWGGEAWQVGGDYIQYDDSLFQSVRLNSWYYTIPGPDLGVYGDDIARIGFIRRTIMGAERVQPDLAVFAPTEWNNYFSLANIATRLDFPVDIISSKTRFDFSIYKLLVMPDRDYYYKTGTGGGSGLFMPEDEYWYWLLRESVEKGLNILMFPGTGKYIPYFRNIFGIKDIKFENLKNRTIEFFGKFGKGVQIGKVYTIAGPGKILLTDTNNEPVLLEHRIGKGSVLIAGFEPKKGSLDKEFNYEKTAVIKNHTLLRLCRYIGIKPQEYDTGNLFVFKEMLHKKNRDFFLLFSHNKEVLHRIVKVRLLKKYKYGLDLATGDEFVLHPAGSNWYNIEITLYPRTGRYIMFL